MTHPVNIRREYLFDDAYHHFYQYPLTFKHQLNVFLLD